MKSLLVSTAVFFLLFPVCAGAASSSSAVQDFSLNSISFVLPSSGLTLYDQIIHGATTRTYPVNQIGSTYQIGWIGTNEKWINSDDLNPGKISVIFTFSDPEGDKITPVTISGTSVGWNGYLGLDVFQGWKVTWNGSGTGYYGNGGKFTVSLNNMSYENLLSPAGREKLDLTLTLNSMPRPTNAPIPPSILLMGFGLVGLLGIRRIR